jgi:hypothetical protein
MKAREWQAYLEEQRRHHGKFVFTTTELANVAGRSPHALNVELKRLITYGVIERYAHGRYGLPGMASPEILLPSLDPGAYITASYALFHHQLIMQVPARITCFTSRRHGRARLRSISAGDLVFVCVRTPIYAPPREGVYAGPEQALCDLFYLASRSGISPREQVTFRNMQRIRISRLSRILQRYPATVRKQLVEVDELRPRLSREVAEGWRGSSRSKKSRR